MSAPVRVAGVDEAGRGPLAGPVVAAAVILDPDRPIEGLADSKALAPEVRTRLALELRERALAWSVALASPAEIDTLNILQATLLAMRRALAALSVAPDHVEIDGNRPPRLDGLVWAQAAPAPTLETVVRGDASRPAISAASILAKTVRDTLMEQLDTRHPGYGFAVHKGYPTAAHLAALRAQGISLVHRRSFGPVRLLAL
ncbi:MAG: ribonuclease HII [Gammaproteobacteria bacterium]